MSGHMGLCDEWHHRLVGDIGQLGLKEVRRGAETDWGWRTLHDLAPGPNPDSARTRKRPRTGPSKNRALNPHSSLNPNWLGREPRTSPNFWCLGAFGRSSYFEAGVENLAQTAAARIELVLDLPPPQLVLGIVFLGGPKTSNVLGLGITHQHFPFANEGT